MMYIDPDFTPQIKYVYVTIQLSLLVICIHTPYYTTVLLLIVTSRYIMVVYGSFLFYQRHNLKQSRILTQCVIVLYYALIINTKNLNF